MSTHLTSESEGMEIMGVSGAEEAEAKEASVLQSPLSDNADEDRCHQNQTVSRRVSHGITERVLSDYSAHGETHFRDRTIIADILTGGRYDPTEEARRGSLARNMGVGSASPLFLELNIW